MNSHLPPATWVLNPALRFYDAGGDGQLVELDDRNGRTLRMSISAEAVRLLQHFRHGSSWHELRHDLVAAGVAPARLQAFREFLEGPCCDRRILIRPRESAPAVDQPVKPAYVSALINVIPWRFVNPISGLLQWMFATPALVVGAVAIAVSAGAMFIAMHSMGHLPALGAAEILLVIATSAIGVLLHELGHAAAAYRLGARRVSIGIGWYIAIPVAYSELSELWRYPRERRLVVNLAGVYMQGLLIACLMVMFHAQHDAVWLVAASATATSVLWNLNPLLRMDGYWIAADSLGVPDLRRRSAQALRNAIRRAVSEEGGDAASVPGALVIYGLMSSVFLAALLVRAISFLLTTATVSLPELFRKAADWQSARPGTAEYVLLALAVVWNALLLQAVLRLLSGIPARLMAWWRPSRQPE